MTDKNWEVEVEKINSEVKLLSQKLDIIENNHLVHIQKSIDTLNKICWTVGFMVFAQFFYILRPLLIG